MILGWDEVVRAVEARAISRPGVQISGWSIDTRTLEAGDLFFALAGPEHDGHDYVRAAFEKGAAGALVERDIGVPHLMVVPETLAALQGLAAWARCRWGGQI